MVVVAIGELKKDNNKNKALSDLTKEAKLRAGVSHG